MPFTLAHPAAALPFRKTRLVFSAVIVGSMAPDFEYFLRLAPQGRYFHSLPGLFLCTLPVAFAVLWLFHRSAKLCRDAAAAQQRSADGWFATNFASAISGDSLCWRSP